MGSGRMFSDDFGTESGVRHGVDDECSDIFEVGVDNMSSNTFKKTEGEVIIVTRK